MKQLLLFLFFIFLWSCTERPANKEDNAFYDKAFEYRARKPDSAFVYFSKAKDLFSQQGNKFGAGKCLLNMAMISTDRGDYFGGQEFSLQAIPCFDSANEKHFAFILSNFNNLGLAFHHAENYNTAIDFYQQSFKYTKDPARIITINNNIANSYVRLHQYQKAIAIYNNILKKNINTIDFSRALSNLAFTKWLQNPDYKAAPELLKSLHFWLKEKDLPGQNMSYSHLSDYYAKAKPDSALIYAHKMYATAKALNVADDQLQALQKLIRLGGEKAIKQYFEIYKNLDDSVENSRNTTKNQFALIRYGVEKSKADNLELKYQIIKQKAWLLVTALVVIFGSVLLIFWYRKRKKRLQQEKDLEVKNTELKYVKKIHDRVANKVYHVMSEVENTTQLDKTNLLDKLEIIYDISRDISYETRDLDSEENFAQQLAKMLKSYSSGLTKITIVGNEEKIWEPLTNTSKTEIFYVLQELMTNMKKHSQAKAVAINFHQQENMIRILYEDNGIGMKTAIPKNGLANTETRIKSISGAITFDQTVEKGVKIQISCPFS